MPAALPPPREWAKRGPGWAARSIAPPVEPARRSGMVKRTRLGKSSGSYSLGIGVEAKRLVFVSGCVATDASGAIVGKGDVGAQTRQAFANMSTVLAEAGATLKDVVKITTFLVPMERYAEFSAVRAE